MESASRDPGALIWDDHLFEMTEYEDETVYVLNIQYMVENLSQNKLRYFVICESTKTLIISR